MLWQATPYTPPLVAAAMISLALAAYAWGRNSPGSRPFSLLMVAISVWSLGYGLVLAAPDLPSKIFWAKTSYLGITTVPLAWLIFCLQYTGRGRWVNGRRTAVLAVLPLTTLALAWSNEAHGLIWAKVQLDPLSPGLWVQHGWWFWVHVALSYGALTYGSSLLLWALVRSSQLYRRQAAPLVVAVVAPWVGNVAYILDLLPTGRLDPTPFAFTISGLALAWSLFRAHLLEYFLGLIPLARDATIEGMRDGVLVLDAYDRVVDLNPAAAHILATPAAQALGAPVGRLLEGWPEIGAAVSGDVSTELLLRTGAEQRYFDLLISPLRPREEQSSGRLVVLHDITARKHTEDALRQSETRLLLALEGGRMGIWEWRVGSNAVVWSPGLEAIHGLDPGAFGGTFEAYLNDVHPDDRERVQQAIDRARQSRSDLHIEYRILWPDQTVRWIEGRGRPFCDQSGQLVRFVGTCMDVTQRKTAEDALVYQALYDSLTGLPNRTLLQDRLAQALLAAERNRRRLALLLMDLDGFKDVNDTLGHHTGDLVLREVGRRLQKTVRTSDTVARLGGDEFAVVLTTASGARAAQLAAQRLLRALEPPIQVYGHRLRVRGSVGIALFPEHGQDGTTLLRRADVAMYAAKRARSGYSMYDTHQDQNSLVGLTLVTEQPEALEHEQLVPGTTRSPR